ncbi:oxidoreductase [Strigomonas culicis]|uniref:Oxidoreductase n=1 Tax=Strigomonas culicis TaxID=28005 RepID=S9VXM7_9TRYP|nr:oxidoreductase [Strigomonas culicis]|eukprot:EPY28400.1 oxidoreductase [Strigomonas culicis]
MASTTFKKIIAHEVSPNFRQSTRIVDVPFAAVTGGLKPSEVLVKNHYVGINASDVNYVNGKYMPGVVPPFDVGFEAIGEVVEVGGGGGGRRPPPVKKNDYVVTQCFGAFAEYQVVPLRYVKPVPRLETAYLPLDLSGTTASICLEHVLQPRVFRRGADGRDAPSASRLTADEVVARGAYHCPERAVVTAAAGGTGQFAAQLLKHKYRCACVVGLCSSDAKAAFLADTLRLDGAVNYKQAWRTHAPPETGDFASCIAAAVSAAFNAHERRADPKRLGANLVYESVGGELLEAMVASLALHGRIASIGSISSYTSGWREDRPAAAQQQRGPLPLQLLAKSASLHTFLLPHYAKYANQHFAELCTLWEAGVIQSTVDDSQSFRGIASVYDAVDYLYAGKNCGKVIVKL